MRREKFKGGLNVPVAAGIVGVHLLAIPALFPQFFTWSGVLICIFLYWLTGWVGITLNYHRQLTHKSFETSNWLRYIFTTIGLLAFQGGPIMWVGNHRLHHKHADTDADPHTPRHGFSWAHILWLFFKRPEGEDPRSVVRDLIADKGIVLLDRLFWVPQAFVTVLLFVIGLLVSDIDTAWSWVFWGTGLRTALVYHVTWFTNSAAHTWGYRNFETKDDSRNLWWVFSAFLLGGEGFHNNHHKYQASATHGMFAWEPDPTYWTIRALELVGLAWNIKKPDKARLLARRKIT